ncbi:MAG TPA: methyltransferase domain-containing protein [Terriglobia bacterium]|nr:methyltransferase domain-containing protein [Terriglobia bacterium]
MKQRRKNGSLLAGLGAIVWGAWVALAGQIGSRPAAEWIPHLENPQRVAGLQIDEVLKIIGVQPGMVIADIGSGSGVFTRPFAKAVAPAGRAIAVDIDSALLSYISERAAKEGIQNIETHLAVPDDARLSGPIVDVAFFHDVLHHIEHPDVYMKNLAKYLKPDGRIVIIENASHGGQHAPAAGGPNASMHEALHGNQRRTMQHRGQVLEMASERQKVDAMLAAAGFYPARESDLFGSDKFFVIYSRQKN